MPTQNLESSTPRREPTVMPSAKAINTRYGLEAVVPDKMPGEIAYFENPESVGVDPDVTTPPDEVRFDFGYDDLRGYLVAAAVEHPDGVEQTVFNGVQSMHDFEASNDGSYGGVLRSVVLQMLEEDKWQAGDSLGHRERSVLELCHGIGGTVMSRQRIGTMYRIGEAQVGIVYRSGAQKIREQYSHLEDFIPWEEINRGLANPRHAERPAKDVKGADLEAELGAIPQVITEQSPTYTDEQLAKQQAWLDEILAKQAVGQIAFVKGDLLKQQLPLSLEEIISMTNAEAHPVKGAGKSRGDLLRKALKELANAPHVRWQERVDEARARMRFHGAELVRAETELRQLLLDRVAPAE